MINDTSIYKDYKVKLVVWLTPSCWYYNMTFEFFSYHKVWRLAAIIENIVVYISSLQKNTESLLYCRDKVEGSLKGREINNHNHSNY